MFQHLRERATYVVRWSVLATVVGIFSGLLSAAFIESLNWANDTRSAHHWLVFTLPVAGLIIGLLYHYVGHGLERGSNLIIEQIHEHSRWIPLRLTPLIFGASVLTHVVGGSSGREGAAIQLAVGVTDPISKKLGLTTPERSIMLIAAIAGGFGSIFGVPVAGAVFALEVQRVGRVRYEALVPAFVASFVGDATVRVLGIHHTPFPRIANITWSPTLAWQVLLFGLIAGLIAMAFVRATHLVRDNFKKYIPWYPARPMIGGIILVILILAFGWREYSGLSTPLLLAAMNDSASGQWITKLGLTALTIGSGFAGGEVTPLLVIGALAGASYAHTIGANVALFAIIGSVAVLAGAANTPLACTFLGLELFGGNGLIVFAVVCAAAYATSGHAGIYHAQPRRAHKSGNSP